MLDEVNSLEQNLARYKREAEQAQEQLRKRQEELKALSGETPTPPEGVEAEQLKAVLDLLVQRGWTHLRSLEKTLGKAPRLIEDENSAPANDLSTVEALLSRRSAYRQELANKLRSEHDRLRDHIESRWKALGREHASSDVAEALRQLLQTYSAHLDTHSAQTDVSGRQQLEAILTRLQSRRETLTAEVNAKKAQLAELQVQLRTLSGQQAEAEVLAKDTEEQVASLEEDIGIKRQLLVHVNGELAAAERRHAKAEEDLALAREQLRSDPLFSEVETLEERQRLLASEQSELKQEMAERKATVQQQAKRIAQLEESLKESEEGAAGELDVRMLSMQSTLQELYKSIQEGTDDNI